MDDDDTKKVKEPEEGKINPEKFGWDVGDFEMVKVDALKLPEQRPRRRRPR